MASHEGEVESPLHQKTVSENIDVEKTVPPCAGGEEEGLSCMPLTESFHDEVPPITECFKCDVEEYEHEHEIGPHHHHHHHHNNSQSSRNESAEDGVDVNDDVSDAGGGVESHDDDDGS